MSKQPNCATARPWASLYGFDLPTATAELHVRGGGTSHDLERWSG
jgi:hypothetical protein